MALGRLLCIVELLERSNSYLVAYFPGSSHRPRCRIPDATTGPLKRRVLTAPQHRDARGRTVGLETELEGLDGVYRDPVAAQDGTSWPRRRTRCPMSPDPAFLLEWATGIETEPSPWQRASMQFADLGKLRKVASEQGFQLLLVSIDFY